VKKNSTNKGFIKELASKPKSTESKKDFKYSNPVVTPSSSAFNTPKRIANFKAVADPKSNICNEFVEIRGKK
jgi:hypothetical protein